MRYLSTFLFICICSYCFAQVGINTSNPNPSSILDVFSTTQGLLTPRMTSAQKNAIASPATGLLVFDTTLNSFQFYDGTAWVFVTNTKFRNNHKLIKNISDLSEELTAGGGTRYLLKTNFLYEINGVINVNFPIELNGAYIEGVDSSEDILVNTSSGSLFQGTKGGALRNITLNGNGKEIINITAPSSELLLISNTVFAGASKVGTLSGLGTVFLSVTQYVSNLNGLSINNIAGFFVSNIFWTTSNSGTFMEFTGSFNNLQMNGGRIEVDAGETGIDVSNNPIIVNNASLSQLSFVGGSAVYVKAYTTGSYTGFNFNKSWDVNCPGIPTETDQTASANIYYGGGLTTGYSQPITDGTPVQIKSGTNFVATNLFRFTAADNNNDLIYDGRRRRNVQVNASLSIRVFTAVGDFYAFALAKNGTILTETNSTVQIASDAQIQNVALNGVIQVNPGDRIEIFVTRLTGGGTDNLVVFSENMSVR